jgi:hypothetical protein
MKAKSHNAGIMLKGAKEPCPSPIFDFVEISELINVKQQRARIDDAIRPLPEFE